MNSWILPKFLTLLGIGASEYQISKIKMTFQLNHRDATFQTDLTKAYFRLSSSQESNFTKLLHLLYTSMREIDPHI